MKTLLATFFVFSLTSIAGANSFALSAIEIPSSSDIVAFTNGLPPATGSRVTKSKEEIIHFLEAGRPARIAPSAEDHVKMNNQPGEIADGVFTTKDGAFFFWRLISNSLLWLQTPSAGSVIIEINQ